MKTPRWGESHKYVLTLLRISIGWHLLYEGLIKLSNPDWTSAGYLLNSPFAVFRSLVSTESLTSIVDFLNIAGLVLAGLFLFLGWMTKPAALSGAALLLLYYVSNPPWSALGPGTGAEGHYLMVNKNLIEALALLLVAMLPPAWFFSLDRIRAGRKGSALPGGIAVPEEMNHTVTGPALERRQLVKNLISLPLLGGFAFAWFRNHGWPSFEERHLAAAGAEGITGATARVTRTVDLSQLVKPVAKGSIGNVEMGRLICGGNLISGFSHSRDLIYVSNFLRQYFTDEKVMETFWICEQCGIDTTALRTAPREIEILNAYWKRGGKMKWLAPAYPKEDNYRENIDLAIDNGAVGVSIMGNIGDQWVKEGKVELIGEVVEYIRSKKVIAGLTGHELATFQAAEAAGVQADYYQKTLHARDYWSWRPEEKKEKMVIDNYAIDNYWDRTPDETVEFMAALGKPWIAFKILAAGAIHPRDGFRYAFESGADFACVGMFDFQVVEDANLFTEVVEGGSFQRSRPWMA
jgi:uncharacterized membrane protein YphA (DoxX/SURF4 family)